ncbi:MAG TPA: AAA domain-containing protein, partial [Kofleriaceae bacterium]
LASVFAPGLAEVLARRPPPDQAAAIRRRLARLARVRTLARDRIAHHVTAIRDLEAEVVGRARIVMCTLTQAYLSPLMKPQRFDVLVAEEAGMATLPSLFCAACLCRDKAIMVGDPRQLPPIVHARDDLVQRAIGRSVFEVTIPDPTRSDVVAMLDVQYRMHPVIGTLVGRLFYDGRLRHGADPARTTRSRRGRRIAACRWSSSIPPRAPRASARPGAARASTRARPRSPPASRTRP